MTMFHRLLERVERLLRSDGRAGSAAGHPISTPGLWNKPDMELYRLFLENTRHDLHKWHHYFSIYERYFAQFRDRPIALLEIGVARGGSLRLWRDYFGSTAQITGIDIDPDCARYHGEDVEVFIGDQADAGFLQSVAERRGPFDVVIDDGGHTMRQQIVSFETLFPSIRDGGIYLVEDLHTNLWPSYFDHPLGISFLDVATRMAEKLTWWHHEEQLHERYRKPMNQRRGEVIVPEVARHIYSMAFYDSVVVFEKGTVLEPRHEIR
jgi:23S rRNA U2552 (ribose-2'-O)-methylase RlmE/FtsJ